jgi:hypothetical protein
MSTFTCTRCDGTGFLNIEQVDEETRARYDETRDPKIIFDWIDSRDAGGECSCHIQPPCRHCELAHDVCVCDCCGDGEGWYNEPGQHDWDNPEDPKGCR